MLVKDDLNNVVEDIFVVRSERYSPLGTENSILDGRIPSGRVRQC